MWQIFWQPECELDVCVRREAKLKFSIKFVINPYKLQLATIQILLS